MRTCGTRRQIRQPGLRAEQRGASMATICRSCTILLLQSLGCRSDRVFEVLASAAKDLVVVRVICSCRPLLYWGR